jgi:hypothetical protein
MAQVFAVMFQDNQKELVGQGYLFFAAADAECASDDWNRDYPVFTTRPATVVPMEVK